MGQDKRMDFGAGAPSAGAEGSVPPRARNRTVMLTSEVTGQVRARLLEEVDQQTPQLALDAPAGMIEPQGDTGDFAVPVVGNKNTSASASTGSFALFEEGYDQRQSELDAPPQESVEAPPATRRREIGMDKGRGMNSGATNTAAAAAGKSSQENVFWTKETPVIGFLVSFDANPNGEVYVLRSGRLVVSSEPPTSGSYMLINDDSVSPNHAILRISAGGEIQILDQLSESGTKIQRFGSEEDEELSGEKSSLEHGDCITFGKRRFHVCILPVGA